MLNTESIHLFYCVSLGRGGGGFHGCLGFHETRKSHYGIYVYSFIFIHIFVTARFDPFASLIYDTLTLARKYWLLIKHISARLCPAYSHSNAFQTTLVTIATKCILISHIKLAVLLPEREHKNCRSNGYVDLLHCVFSCCLCVCFPTK